MRLLRNSAGFSITELLVVMAIISVVLAVAMPNFVRVTGRDRVEAAAYDFERVVTLARQKAVAKRRPYRVSLNTFDRTFYVERKEGAGWSRDPNETFALHPSIGIDLDLGGNPANTVLLIEAQGTIAAEDAPATVRFHNESGDTASVSIVRTGRIRTRVG